MKVAQDKADRAKDMITRQYSQRLEKGIVFMYEGDKIVGQPMNKHVRRKSLPIPTEEKKE